MLAILLRQQVKKSPSGLLKNKKLKKPERAKVNELIKLYDKKVVQGSAKIIADIAHYS